MTSLRRFLAASTFLAAAFVAPAHAQVAVADAWVRATVPQQKATGAFMRLTAAKDAKLVSASSPLTPVVEVHEMALQNDVMKMRHVPALALPAGQAVELKPGGYHLMLMNLTQQVKEGEQVPLTLVIEGQDGKRESVQVQATVRALTAPAGGAHGAGHKH